MRTCSDGRVDAHPVQLGAVCPAAVRNTEYIHVLPVRVAGAPIGPSAVGPAAATDDIHAAVEAGGPTPDPAVREIGRVGLQPAAFLFSDANGQESRQEAATSSAHPRVGRRVVHFDHNPGRLGVRVDDRGAGACAHDWLRVQLSARRMRQKSWTWGRTHRRRHRRRGRRAASRLRPSKTRRERQVRERLDRVTVPGPSPPASWPGYRASGGLGWSLSPSLAHGSASAAASGKEARWASDTVQYAARDGCATKGRENTDACIHCTCRCHCFVIGSKISRESSGCWHLRKARSLARGEILFGGHQSATPLCLQTAISRLLAVRGLWWKKSKK